MGGEAQKRSVRLGTKKITHTLIHAPKISDTPLFLPFYYSPEGRRRYPSNSLPPSHAALVEQTAICNSKLLNIVSRPPPPPPLLLFSSSVSSCRQMFFPRPLFQYLPSQEWSWPPKSLSLSRRRPRFSGDCRSAECRCSTSWTTDSDRILTSVASRWRIS